MIGVRDQAGTRGAPGGAGLGDAVPAKWTIGEPAPAGGPPLTELIVAAARARPDWPAVVQSRRSLSYAELLAASWRLARRLRSAGAGAESRVAICLERTPELVVAVLGVLLAGAAYVPVGVADPTRRRDWVLRDAGAGIAVVDEAGRRTLGADGGGRVLIEVSDAGAAGDADARPGDWPAPHRAQAAYVLYTSGSTGRPKGVLVEHGALADGALAARGPAGIDGATRSLAYASLGFDVSVYDMLLPLTQGGTVALVPEADRVDPSRLERFAAAHEVTWALIPPPLLPVLRPERMPTLARVLTGGSAPSPEQVVRWQERRFANWYGPTETVVGATGGDLTGSWDRPLPLGGPLPGRRLYVLDERLRPVAVGQEGELYIGGVGIARGYLNQPALTAQRFLPDPFGAVPGARMYATGDQVRWMPDGTLTFLGRRDGQVKVQGQRAELGEIVAVLAAHPGVGQVAVDARQDPDGVRLVAYVSPRTAPDAAQLAEYCASRLPKYMVPGRVYRLDSLPLNASDKIDLAALRLLAGTDRDAGGDAATGGGATTAGGYRAASYPTVARVWAQLFGGGQPRPDDDFLDRGGHSLTAMRLVAELRTALRREVAVEDVLRGRTVRGLAERVDRAPATTGEPSRGNPPALTPGQRRLWFIDQFAPHASAYNIALALRLEGRLDVPALRAALGAVAERHEVLRWRIAHTVGVPRVLVDPPGPADLEVSELPGGPGGDELDEFAGRPFDTGAEPLWRARLWRTGQQRYLLAVTLHHAVFDGWSQGIYLRDLATAYREAAAGRVPRWEPAPFGFADYAAWRADLARRHSAADLDWALAHFDGVPAVLDLARDRPRPPVQTFRGARVRSELPASAAGRVRALARRLATTPSTVLLAGFAQLLGRLTGARDLVIGTPVADRRHPAFQDLVGLLLDTVPLRLRPDPAAAFTEQVLACHEEMLGALAHREAPLERLVDRLRVPRDPSRNPLINVLFNVPSVGAPRIDLPGLRVEPAEAGLPGSPFDLTLYVDDTGAGAVGLVLLYNPDLFDAPRIGALAEGYAHLIEQLTAEPDTACGHAALRPSAVGRCAGGAGQALGGRPAGHPAGSGEPVGRLPGVLERVEAAGRRWPERPAVIDGDASLTRRELLGLSAAVAGALAAGAEAPGVVAVLAERCAHLPAALLGVLRSGARWLLLDGALPPAALARHAAAAGAAALLACPHVEVPAELAGSLRIGWPDVSPAAGPAVPAAPGPAGDGDTAADAGYLMLTSGTTGRPSVVSCSGRPLAHFLRWYPDEYGLGPADRFAMVGGLGHDPLLRDVFVPLVIGAELHVPPAGALRDPAALSAWLADRRITVLHASPPLLRMLGPAAPARPAAQAGGEPRLPSLRLVVSGGDQLTAGDVQRLRRVAPGARIVNAYGTTETPQIHARYEVDTPPGAEPGRPVPVGRGAPGSELLVLDDRGRPAAVGELGHLVVRGAFLADGYLDRGVADRELTAQRFGRREGVPVFHTGDLGRYDADGQVTVAGRADGQVNIRGHRIELGEVEAALAAHPDVTAAAAAVVTRAGEPALAGYAVPGSGATTGEDLREYLRRVLPEYAVPLTVMLLDRLPLTPNGKLDRSALGRSTVDTAGPERGSSPADPLPATKRPAGPLSATERLVADLWRAVLGVPAVSPTDNFFEAGGSSLAIVAVASGLSEALHRPVAVADLFRYPTVRGLAAFLDRGERDQLLDRAAARVTARRERLRRREDMRAGRALTTEE